jgi:4-amino-4-deoxy-L-arabinose transferase-like glycosyltransferase
MSVRRVHRAPPAGLIAVVALAAVVRGLVLHRTAGYVPFGDAVDYDRIAASLSVLGDYPATQWALPGSPTAFRGPAYPYLLSWAYDLTGGRFGAGRAVGLALGASSTGLVWGIARELWDRRRASIAGALYAVSPSVAWLAGALLAENLFLPVLLAATFVVLRYRHRPRLGLAFAVGALCGIAALTRPNGAAIALPLLWGLWATSRSWRHPGAALLAMVVVMAPWAARNTETFGRFVPLGTASGYTLSGAWNPESARPGPLFAASRNPPEIPAWADLFRPARFDEAQLERRLRSRAVRFGVDHPWFVARATGVHLLRQFRIGPGHSIQSDLGDRELGVPDPDRWMLSLGLAILVLFALGSMARTRRPSSHPAWLWALPFVVLVPMVVGVGSPRYRVAVDPFLVLAATPAASALVRRSTRRRRPARGATVDGMPRS